MEINVKEKADALVLLSDYPSLLIWFLVILVIVIAGTIIITVSKSNPNLFNNWLHFKRKNTPENERRQNKRRKDDRDDKPLVDEICNDCVKSSVQNIQKSVDAISETLKKMNAEIARATINAGLAATGGDLSLTDHLRIVFDLWRKGVNGNTVSATKIKIMKEDGLKIWNSELSYNRHKYQEGDKHFQDCVKKIEDGLT